MSFFLKCCCFSIKQVIEDAQIKEALIDSSLNEIADKLKEDISNIEDSLKEITLSDSVLDNTEVPTILETIELFRNRSPTITINSEDINMKIEINTSEEKNKSVEE